MSAGFFIFKIKIGQPSGFSGPSHIVVRHALPYYAALLGVTRNSGFRDVKASSFCPTTDVERPAKPIQEVTMPPQVC